MYQSISITTLVIVLSSMFAEAQELRPSNLGSIEHTIKKRLLRQDNGKSFQVLLEESFYDTNAVLIKRNRKYFDPIDEGINPTHTYHYDYNPKTRRGEYYTKLFTHKAKPKQKAGKRLTRFSSYDHANKKNWIKQYNQSNQLKEYTVYDYDKKGSLTQSIIERHELASTIKTVDKLKRNERGEKVLWKSYDEEDSRKEQVREVKWKYHADTLLVETSGYLYGNWHQEKYKYIGRKKMLKRVTKYRGTRNSKGKIRKTSKEVLSYSNNRLLNRKVYDLGKKIFESTYTYDLTTKSEHKIYKTGEQQHIEVKNVELDSLTKEYSLKENQDLKHRKLWKKDAVTKRLVYYEEYKKQSIGSSWKREIHYNQYGNPVEIIYYVNGEESYRENYSYFYRKD